MLGTCSLCLARSASLREAADVLRTDRRTEGEEKAAKVNANKGCLQLLTQRAKQTMRRLSLLIAKIDDDEEWFPGTRE